MLKLDAEIDDQSMFKYVFLHSYYSGRYSIIQKGVPKGQWSSLLRAIGDKKGLDISLSISFAYRQSSYYFILYVIGMWPMWVTRIGRVGVLEVGISRF